MINDLSLKESYNVALYFNDEYLSMSLGVPSGIHVRRRKAPAKYFLRWRFVSCAGGKILPYCLIFTPKMQYFTLRRVRRVKYYSAQVK